MIAVLATLAWIFGPLGMAVLVSIPSLIVVATVITRRDSARVQLCQDVARDRQRQAARD